MERDLKIVQTPIGKNKVEIKSWLTGREKRLIQSVFTDDISFKGKEYEVSGKKISEAQDTTIVTAIVSIDGSKDKILERVLDMHSVDFDFIIAEINKITNPTPEEIKK